MIGRPRCLTARPEFEKPLSARSNDWPNAFVAENSNEMSSLDRDFADAPMMEWTGRAEKQSAIST
jgi:hypothetical protein